MFKICALFYTTILNDVVNKRQENVLRIDLGMS